MQSHKRKSIYSPQSDARNVVSKHMGNIDDARAKVATTVDDSSRSPTISPAPPGRLLHVPKLPKSLTSPKSASQTSLKHRSNQTSALQAVAIPEKLLKNEAPARTRTEKPGGEGRQNHKSTNQKHYTPVKAIQNPRKKARFKGWVCEDEVDDTSPLKEALEEKGKTYRPADEVRSPVGPEISPAIGLGEVNKMRSAPLSPNPRLPSSPRRSAQRSCPQQSPLQQKEPPISRVPPQQSPPQELASPEPASQQPPSSPQSAESSAIELLKLAATHDSALAKILQSQATMLRKEVAKIEKVAREAERKAEDAATRAKETNRKLRIETEKTEAAISGTKYHKGWAWQ